MSLPEEQPRPEEPAAPQEPGVEGFFPEENALPDGYTPIGGTPPQSHIRRRRARHPFIVPGTDERAVLVEGLARRASPSFEFFLFAFLAGAVLGAAFLLDSPAVLLLGIVLAPTLTPWAGLTLSIQTGSWKFFFQTLISLLVAGLLVFFTGVLAGWTGRLWSPLPLFHANYHSHLWWPDLFIVVLAAIVMVIAFVRSEQKPILPSIMLAYGLFLPLSAGGVGLGLGKIPVWPDGVLVFLVHLALSILVGIITFAFLRFKPVRASGYLLPILLGLLCIVALAYFTGLPQTIRNEILATRHPVPTSTPLLLPTSTSQTSTLASTATSIPADTATPTLENTPTDTSTLEPPLVFAVINASSPYNGANVRDGPGGSIIITLANSNLVQVLPGTENASGSVWTHIRTSTGVEGWVLQNVLSPTTRTFPTATPTP